MHGGRGLTPASPVGAERCGPPVARACMLSFYFHPAYSGSAVQAHNLCRWLLARGITSEIVSANLTGSPKQDRCQGIAVRRLRILLRKELQIPSFGLSLAWHLLRQRRTFDVVHAHGTLPHAAAAVIAKALGKKSILKIAMANSDIAFQRQGRIWGRVNRFFVRRFDRYVATSEEIRVECLEQKLDPARIVVIPNGVDTDAFTPPATLEDRRRLRQELGLPDVPVVCFVGIIDARKNVDAVLRIWRDVSRGGAKGHLLLIGPEPSGPDGNSSEYCRRMRQYVEDEGLSASVSFLGRRPDVAAHLRSADVFLFPSRREGMPNVLLEAMASGVACIASNIGGSVDLIEHGKSGYLFDVDDEAGMTAAIDRLLRHPTLAWSMGSAARRSMVSRFSLEATADRYLSLYRELLSEKAGSPRSNCENVAPSR